jgi:hypothetical protein
MTPLALLRFEGEAFLGVLAATLAYRMLTRRINLRRLLARKDGSGTVSPERVQLLMTTLALAARYVRDSAHAGNGAMPDVSAEWLAVFGGSSGLYAGIKAFTTWKSND